MLAILKMEKPNLNHFKRLFYLKRNSKLNVIKSYFLFSLL